MKKIAYFVVMLAVMLTFSHSVSADQYVKGYYRSNGTYVNGYYRSSPDSSPYNNYSYPGNTNPYTGKTATGNSSTYLNSYNGYSASAYNSYVSTPTCPINSYSSGSSCKCNYGYVVQGSGCVSGTSYCLTAHGYDSSYDSLSNTCKCDPGYYLGSSSRCTQIQASYSLTGSSDSTTGVVAYKKYSCDYFIVEDGGGNYNLLEWYGQHDPSEGDILYGNFHTYGFKDFYDATYKGTTHVWIEDWLLSWSRAIEKYEDKCD